jgi:hypothetical protein
MTDGHHVGDEPGFARISNGQRILLRYNKATDDWNGPVFQIRRGMISVNEMVTENAVQGTGAMGSQGTGVMGTGVMGTQGTGVMGSPGTDVPVIGVSVMAMDPEDQGDGDMDSDDDESTETTDPNDENQGSGDMNVERD